MPQPAEHRRGGERRRVRQHRHRHPRAHRHRPLAAPGCRRNDGSAPRPRPRHQRPRHSTMPYDPGQCRRNARFRAWPGPGRERRGSRPCPRDACPAGRTSRSRRRESQPCRRAMLRRITCPAIHRLDRRRADGVPAGITASGMSCSPSCACSRCSRRRRRPRRPKHRSPALDRGGTAAGGGRRRVARPPRRAPLPPARRRGRRRAGPGPRRHRPLPRPEADRLLRLLQDGCAPGRTWSAPSSPSRRRAARRPPSPPRRRPQPAPRRPLRPMARPPPRTPARGGCGAARPNTLVAQLLTAASQRLSSLSSTRRHRADRGGPAWRQDRPGSPPWRATRSPRYPASPMPRAKLLLVLGLGLFAEMGRLRC